MSSPHTEALYWLEKLLLTATMSPRTAAPQLPQQLAGKMMQSEFSLQLSYSTGGPAPLPEVPLPVELPPLPSDTVVPQAALASQAATAAAAESQPNARLLVWIWPVEVV